MKRTGGARFDPTARCTFFMAGSNLLAALPLFPDTLIALNDLLGGTGELDGRVSPPEARVLMDSGIFNLTNRHARAHRVTMDEALSMPPDQIDGFDDLLARYHDVVTAYEDRLWGYIELDQGGADHKRATRHQLEQDGLRPIPVYHPLNDGWDYLDELLDEYDRICVGNVVQARPDVRRTLLATVWERRRRAKHKVWIHVLGFTPNELFTALPFNSADSSSAIYSLRFGAQASCFGRGMLKQFSHLDYEFSYDRQLASDDDRGQVKKTAVLAWILATERRAWHAQQDDLQELLPKLAQYPKVRKRERAPAPAQP